MKKLFLIPILLLSLIVYAQVPDSIKNSPKEFLPVVVEIPNTAQSEIYNKIKSWVNRYYKNPDLVLKAIEPNSFIRIDALTTYSFKYMGTSTYNMNYTLEIEIKENKYRVTFVAVNDKQLQTPQMPETFYDPDGKLKKMKVKGKMLQGVLESLNRIHFDLYNSVTKANDKW